MKITICGSCKFTDEALGIKLELEKLGNEVKIWPIEVKDKKGNSISVLDYYQIRHAAGANEKWVWDRKAEAVMEHFEKVKWADSILVLNYDKNGIVGYIGGNTLMEIGLAFWLGKKIYFFNQVPELSYKEELLGVKPIIINEDLTLIK